MKTPWLIDGRTAVSRRAMLCLGAAAGMMWFGLAGPAAEPPAATPPTPAPPGPAATAPAASTPTPSPASASALPDDLGWTLLFDGKTLEGWKVTDFAGHGDATVKHGELHLEMGAMLTGVNYTNKLPTMNYEVSLEAKKLDGSDFFCGLTFPVADSHCTFIVGGWGGSVVGLSSLDGSDASMNETTKFRAFERDRWFLIRVRVQPKRIEAWIDKDKLVDVDTQGRVISMRPGEIEDSRPLGVATYMTSAALRNIRLRPLN